MTLRLPSAFQSHGHGPPSTQTTSQQHDLAPNGLTNTTTFRPPTVSQHKTRISEIHQFRQALSSPQSTGPFRHRKFSSENAKQFRLGTRPGSTGSMELACVCLENCWAFTRMPRRLVALLPRCQGRSAEVWPVAGVYTAVPIGSVSSEAEAMTTPAYSDPFSHTSRAKYSSFVRLIFRQPLYRAGLVTSPLFVTFDPSPYYQIPRGLVSAV